MKTPDQIKLKYFDQLYKTLVDLAKIADEDTPSDLRTIDLRNVLYTTYNLISDIAEEVLNDDRGNREPPNINF